MNRTATVDMPCGSITSLLNSVTCMNNLFVCFGGWVGFLFPKFMPAIRAFECIS